MSDHDIGRDSSSLPILKVAEVIWFPVKEAVRGRFVISCFGLVAFSAASFSSGYMPSDSNISSIMGFEVIGPIDTVERLRLVFAVRVMSLPSRIVAWPVDRSIS